jgi:hypothetical protein
VAREIARIDRFEHAGLSVDAGLVHQARLAVTRGDPRLAYAALAALDGVALAALIARRRRREARDARRARETEAADAAPRPALGTEAGTATDPSRDEPSSSAFA